VCAFTPENNHGAPEAHSKHLAARKHGKANTADGYSMGNDNPLRQTKWQALATARWPGFAVHGDGQWAVVENQTRAVMLLTFEANARNLRLAQQYTRQVFKLELVEKPVCWERDDYSGPSN
jgi:hypothetical protein